MSTLTIQKTWNVNGVPTNPTSMTLASLVENDNSAVIASGVAMTQIGTGVYQYTNSSINGGTTYTATITVVYASQTYTESLIVAPDVTPSAATYPASLTSVLNQLTALLLQITLTPKPSYSVHGHTYSWTEYQEMLTRQMEQVTKLIAQANPYEIVSRG